MLQGIPGFLIDRSKDSSMAAMCVAPSSSKKWMALLAVLVTAGAGVGCNRHEETATPTAASQPAELSASSAVAVPAHDPAAQAAPMSTSAPEPALSAASGAAAQALLTQQAAAAKEVERQPDLKPLVGPIKERPSFVSPMEWTMLQSVSQQNANPGAELTRLVNNLRFMKQLELWQGLPPSASPTQRQALAAQLLEDLPQRLANGEMDFKDAQKTQAALLQDAVPDVKERKKRAAIEARRLVVPAKVETAASSAG
jgi:hypothetical protein